MADTRERRIAEIAYFEMWHENIIVSLCKVINMSKKQKHGSIFASPVDYISLRLPDYLDIVRRPMDFSTLKKNLLSGRYAYFFEFLQDAHLIFQNCRLFNGADSSYSEFASDTENFFMDAIQSSPVAATRAELMSVLARRFDRRRAPLVGTCLDADACKDIVDDLKRVDEPTQRQAALLLTTLCRGQRRARLTDALQNPRVARAVHMFAMRRALVGSGRAGAKLPGRQKRA
eukprot:gnl/Chilomastix_cuspidata/121.p3 GENE.gnl/Chilomastix_cuspidata/121~~gnl/Chilomastix_cuspidata/121.p3  ORF type:complete len:231 (-),score=68.78 gnl/Chilomastix_cuspidata/121:845-1537(-)